MLRYEGLRLKTRGWEVGVALAGMVRTATQIRESLATS